METVREEKAGGSTIRLAKDRDGYTGVVIRDKKIAVSVDGKDPDEVWQQLNNEAYKSKPNFFGFDGAKNRFLKIFNKGFRSPAYLGHERNYKIIARQKLLEAAPLQRAREDKGLGGAVLSVFRATNLLSPFEKTWLQDALRGSDADDFIQAAARFTLGETDIGLSQMKAALSKSGADKWTAVTYLPFLWDPRNHMFLKPEVTREFSERVGHGFADVYEADLKPEVYQSLLDLAAETEAQIVDLEPRDRIDVQSFIWVVGKYGEDTESGLDESSTN